MSNNTILATTPLVTTNFLLRATGTTIGNSLIFDNGTNVGIGNQGTTYALDITGNLRSTTSAYFATTSGSVGIGTTSATSPLSIYYPSTSAEVNYIKMEMPSWGGSVNFKKNIIWHDSAAIVGAIGMSFASNQTYMDFHSFYNTAHTTSTTESTWNLASSTKLQIQNSLLVGYSTTGTFLGMNLNYNAAWKYISTGFASLYSQDSGDHLFFTSSSGTAAATATINEKVRITNAGNVGIGTNAPSFRLTVAQDITNDTGDINVGQFMVCGATTNNKRLVIGYDTNGDGYGYIESAYYNSTWTYTALQPTAGNVVVGKTTNAGQKLQVNGTTQSNGFQSYKGSITLTAGNIGTIYTMAADGLYTVYVRFYGASGIFMASAIVTSLWSNGESFISNIKTASNVGITVSGNDIKVTNGGFGTYTFGWSILYQPVE
jgi:hypothetical protein